MRFYNPFTVATNPKPVQTTVAFGVTGDLFLPTLFRGANRVSLHPLQRAGLVSAKSHDYAPVTPAQGPGGLGQPYYGAGRMNMTLPPYVPIAGSPRDPNFMV